MSILAVVNPFGLQDVFSPGTNEGYKLRALIIVHNDRISGVATFARTTVEGLRERGLVCDLLVIHSTKEAYFKQVGLDAIYLSERDSSSRLRTTLAIRKVIKEGNYSVCHSTSMRPSDIFAIRLAGKRAFGSMHTFAHNLKGLASVSLASMLSTSFACVSHFQKKSLEKWYVRVPKIVREGTFAPNFMSDQGNCVVVVSRLVPHKGLDGLEEWSKVVFENTGWPTVVWGDGELAATMAGHSAPYLVILGNEFDINFMYEPAGVVVILSEVETFCRPAAEAAIRGIPVVCRHRLPAVEEMLGQRAIIGDGSIQSLASAITSTIEMEDATDLRRSLRERAVSNHSTEIQINDLLKLWQVKV